MRPLSAALPAASTGLGVEPPAGAKAMGLCEVSHQEWMRAMETCPSWRSVCFDKEVARETSLQTLW